MQNTEENKHVDTGALIEKMYDQRGSLEFCANERFTIFEKFVRSVLVHSSIGVVCAIERFVSKFYCKY